MVNMGNNGKVSNMTEIGQSVFATVKKCVRSLAYLSPLRHQLRTPFSADKSWGALFVTLLLIKDNRSRDCPSLTVKTNENRRSLRQLVDHLIIFINIIDAAIP